MPEQIQYSGKIFEIVHEPHGTKTFEIARRAPGTRLIIPTSDGKKLLLTKEFRREQNSYDYRLPGGKVFDTLAEFEAFRKSEADIQIAAIEAGKREAREEVGIESEEVEVLSVSKCGATVEWDLIYLLVKKYSEISSGQNLEHGEDITVVPTDVHEVIRMCLTGEMKEERSVAVLLRYFYTKNLLKICNNDRYN